MVFTGGITEGHFRPDADPRQFAQDLEGVMLAFHLASRLLQDPDAERRTRRQPRRAAGRGRPSAPPTDPARRHGVRPAQKKARSFVLGRADGHPDCSPRGRAHLDTVFDGLSARSRYLRFHAPMPAGCAARYAANWPTRRAAPRRRSWRRSDRRGETVPIGLVELADTGDRSRGRRARRGRRLAAPRRRPRVCWPPPPSGGRARDTPRLHGLVLLGERGHATAGPPDVPAARVRFGGETTEFGRADRAGQLRGHPRGRAGRSADRG